MPLTLLGRRPAAAARARGLAMAMAALGLAVSSCSRSQRVPPIPPTPELRIPTPQPATPSMRVPVTRVEWTSSPWIPEQPARDWRYIVIHHTATESGSVESIHQTHLARKDSDGNPWKGIGYHFVVGNGYGMEDGAIEPTFRWRDQVDGAHAGSAAHNQQGIGICLVGNFDKHPPTDAQLDSLTNLIQTLTSEYGISPENIKRHGDVKSTACPGRYFPMEELTQSLGSVGTHQLTE